MLNKDILDSLGEGVITVDKDFRVTFFNRAAEIITGYKRDEVSGRLCKLVFDCELCETKCPIGLVLETNQNIYDFSSNILLKDGSRKSIKLNAAILKNGDGNPTGGVISFRDLSEIEAIKEDRKSMTTFYGIIGHSKAMQRIFELIKEISESDAAVLVQGESGTGKEMIANAIQATSRRKGKPFVKVNCSVFPENLLASELFGHVKGAFTDAIKDRPGRFELADGGTIFLDEVAEMPLQTQIQLLRVLQEGAFERVGESIPRKTNVRVIAATNIEIEKALNTGKLREDLFYRLNVIPVVIPSLRERKEDIPYLVKYFIEDFAKVYRKEINDITNFALDILINYNWPGNVRELENVIEYAVVRTKEMQIITKESLPSSLGHLPITKSIDQKVYKKESAAEIVQLLEKHHWNKTRVAKELGIGRTTLWRMLKDLPEKE
jgi:PAS domain S-box-containing protein